MPLRRIGIAAIVGALLAAVSFASGGDVSAKPRPTIVISEKDLDGGVITGHVQRPEAVYVIPRSEAARQAVDSAGNHLPDALKRGP